MTTVLENQADQITAHSRRIEHLESRLTYTAGVIASMAADNDTGSTVFAPVVTQYRQLRELHAEAKAQYNAALKGEN